MTYEEAFRVVCDLKNTALHTWDDLNNETQANEYNALVLALDALEKQIPKKIKYIYGFGKCPNCGGDTECVMYDYYEPYDYCTKCGQALDWGLEG